MPPSSRSGRRVGYRFATIAALVRQERLPLHTAERMVDDWERYVRGRMREGRSPSATAEHIARFERQRLARPYPTTRRDPEAPRRPDAPRRIGREVRVSARGIPFRQCPRGTRLQAIMFPKERYTVRSAQHWAEQHRFVVRELEEMPNFVRIQLLPSRIFERGSFRNIELSERFGIRGIIGCPLVDVRGRSTGRGARPVPAKQLRRLEVGERRRRTGT